MPESTVATKQLRMLLEEERGRALALQRRVDELEAAAAAPAAFAHLRRSSSQQPGAGGNVEALLAQQARAHGEELEGLQAAHEALVATVSDSYQAQLRALSEHAAVADNDLRRAEGEARALGAGSVGVIGWMPRGGG